MKKTKSTCLVLALILASIFSVISVHAALSDTTVISMSVVNQDPDPAIAGDIVEVRVGVQNIGGQSVNNLAVELIPEYPFTLVPGESQIQKISSLQSYQGYYDDTTVSILKFKTRVDPNTKAGSYELQLRYSEEGSGVKTQKSLPIDVKNKENAEVIHIDKTTLLPGKQSSLTFSINNVGNTPLRDLTFYWENADDIILPVGSDNTRYVKNVNIGESAEIEYQVIADSNAVAGLYKLDLHLTYGNSIDGSSNIVSTIAGVYVGGGTDFDVAFSENANGQTSFSIANIGSNPANSVSVIIPEQRSWRVSGTSSVIIGNLNKGDYTVASFNLQSAASMQNRTQGSANGQYQNANPQNPNGMSQRQGNLTSDVLIMQIAYTDTMGVRTQIEKEIKVSPQNLVSATTSLSASSRRTTNQSFFSKYKYYIIGLAVLLIGFFFYKKHKKMKERNQDLKVKDTLKKSGKFHL